MKELETDVAVIGAGTAGLGARREVEKAGRDSVLIESGPYGTTCARVGCMPSKLLIAAADLAHDLSRAPAFGVHPGEIRIDGAAVMARVKRERDRFTEGVVRSTERIDPAQRLRGHARFVAPDALVVDDHTRVRFRTAVVATGSHPYVPPPFDALSSGVVVNDDVFEWDDLPASCAVVGTGIIALELGQALSRLGVEVAFFNPFEEVGPFTDPALQRCARELFGARLELHLGIEDVAAEQVAGGVRIAWTEAGVRRERVFATVLAAAGRRPNLEGLDLAAAGVPLDARGRPEGWDAETCQIGDLPLFLAGDVSGHRPLLHEASDEGHISGRNAACYPAISRERRRTSLAIAFTDPQMALVGTHHADLEPGSFAAGSVDYADQGRARVMGVNAGLVRLYARRGTCQLVGAEMLGPRVEHMAQLVANAIHRETTVPQMLGMPFYHPVVEEGLRTALRDLGRQLDALGGCPGQDAATCPGD